MMLPYNHSKSVLVFDKILFNKFYDETPTDTQTNPNHTDTHTNPNDTDTYTPS